MPAAKRTEKVGAATPPPDHQEQRALDAAEAALKHFSAGLPSPRSLAAVAISAWIISRTAQAAGVRLNAELLFDLQDARMRGFIEAALPVIGASLAHLPADQPLFALSKEQVVDVFLAGMKGAQEAAVAANESLGFPFDDEIPFPLPEKTGPITLEECTH